MYEFITTRIENGVATVTLNRPEKRNALTRAFIEELSGFVEQVAGDAAVRLLVLQAAGSVFCAGMDLGEMKSRAAADDPEREWRTDSEVYNRLVSQILALPMPTLAVLPGPALAGGVGMVLACDLVVAGDQVYLSLPEPRRGIVAAMVCPLLVYRTNVATASSLLLSGQPLSADRAQTLGLFHQVVAAEELDSTRDSLVASILSGSPTALALTKQHLREVAGYSVVLQIENSAEVSALARKSMDAQEGLAAFLEKRPPSWDNGK